MRPRAPWLVLGGVAFLAACGLSTNGGGLLSQPKPDSGEGADAADTADGSMPGLDSGGGHPPDDASMHEPDAEPDATHPALDGAPGDDGPAASEAGDASGASDAGEAGAVDEAGADSHANTGDGGNDTGTQSGPCDGSAGCVVNVPPGWSLVAFAPDQFEACPSGFGTATNLVESPGAASACTCSTCSVTGQPSCASGTVGVYYDYVATGAGTCGTPGMVPQLNNSPAGVCGSGTDVYHGNYAPFDLAYVPPPSTGGSCSAPGSATGTITYGARDRTCVPSSPSAAGCVGDKCTPSLPSPYAACIMQTGTTSCPAGPLGVRHLAGTGASFGCSDCGCSVSGTCTGSITLYTDNKCTHPGVTIPADRSCNRITSLPNSASNDTFGAYIYTANPPASVQCTASGSSSAENVTLQGTVTICCAQ
ncbi:MAG: hypothetical protein ACRENE_29050 [Polyangiaceae bacterium]